jgi:hypothetical protein
MSVRRAGGSGGDVFGSVGDVLVGVLGIEILRREHT